MYRDGSPFDILFLISVIQVVAYRTSFRKPSIISYLDCPFIFVWNWSLSNLYNIASGWYLYWSDYSWVGKSRPISCQIRYDWNRSPPYNQTKSLGRSYDIDLHRFRIVNNNWWISLSCHTRCYITCWYNSISVSISSEIQISCFAQWGHCIQSVSIITHRSYLWSYRRDIDVMVRLIIGSSIYLQLYISQTEWIELFLMTLL